MTIFSGNLSAQVLPDAAELLARATAKSYPRTIDVTALKSGLDWDGRWALAQYQVTLQYVETLPQDPPSGILKSEIQRITFAEENKTLRASAVWLRTGDSIVAAEAKRRALNLASWSPSGATNILSHDQANRSVARTLALVYDWLYGQWTPGEEEKLLSAIRPRMVDIIQSAGPFGLNNGLKLDKDQYDSHAAVTAAHTSTICTVLAGKDPLYNQCLLDILPRYLARPIPWGTNDGGYGNGTIYAQWDMYAGHFGVWRILKHAIGIDLWKTPWAQQYVNFMVYFLPPGAASGVFGDGAEQKTPDVWATQGKIYAAYIPSPLANWYARSQSGEQRTQLDLLLAPQKNTNLISTSLPNGVAHGIHISSIGWVAMHSDLSNLSRTSIYFKSSPYGSWSHSHADQNSFVIHVAGKVLAADSGYYDSWNSLHYKGWYKATRAHNAITFDGGQGQLQETLLAKGVITQFTNTPNYDLVTGDARMAYGGTLTKAVRSMVFLRPNTLIVFDSLASDTDRTWEWNIHALMSMTIKDSRNIEINQGGVNLCVRQISGPVVTFRQTDQFLTAPSGTYPNQWHGTFSSTIKSKDALFITVLEIGCGNTPVMVTSTSKTLSMTILGNTLIFDGTSVLMK